MEQSTTALVIVAATLVCYTLPCIPVSVTTVLSVLAMAAFGIVTVTEALSGFASTAVFLVVGMMIIGKACQTTGLAELIGRTLYRFSSASERRFIMLTFMVVALMCAIVNTTAVVALMMPVLDSISRMSDGKISRKMTYFPLGISSVLGSGLSSISSSAMIATNEMLVDAGFEPLGLFLPAIVNLPSLLVVFVFYGTLGVRIQGRLFTFDEVPCDDAGRSEPERPGRFTFKMGIVVATIIVVVATIAVGCNSGVVAILAACFVTVTGCVSESEAFSGISWPAVTIVGASIGLSTAITKSGLGILLSELIIEHSGELGTSTLGLSIIIFLVASILSNLLVDTGTIAIMIPVVFSLAQTLGIDVVPLVLACTSGVKVALATPICVGNMTMIQSVGYRFIDYVRMGGLVNMICMVVTCVVIGIVYGF